MPPDHRRVEVADRVRIQHMIDAARSAIRFYERKSRADLDADELLVRGILHAVQEIGEAASRTTQAGRARIPDVP